MHFTVIKSHPGDDEKVIYIFGALDCLDLAFLHAEGALDDFFFGALDDFFFGALDDFFFGVFDAEGALEHAGVGDLEDFGALAMLLLTYLEAATLPLLKVITTTTASTRRRRYLVRF
jgi:hypothetical protein